MTRLAPLPFLALLLACGDVPTEPTPTPDGLAVTAHDGTAIVHHVSAGGPDICDGLGLPMGCDANFSLVANQFADGTVKGQWQDAIKVDGRGVPIHVTVDCLALSDALGGNDAWVSGLITGGPLSGIPVVIRLRDNGKNNQQADFPDQISSTYYDNVGGCTAMPGFFLVRAPQGQVTVW